MRLNTPNQTLFALSSFFYLTSALPFIHRKAAVEPLVRRASYSVVPVDGGPGAAATTLDGAAATVYETIVHTVAPETIIETNVVTQPAVTDYIVSTQTISGKDTTETLLVTITPTSAAVTVIETKYSVVDITSAVTVEVPVPTTATVTTSAPPLSSSSTSPASTSELTSTSSTSAVSPSLPSPSSPSASLLSTTTSASSTSSATLTNSASSETSGPSASYTSTFTLPTSCTTETAFITATPTASATNVPYDNGQYYPSWNSTNKRA